MKYCIRLFRICYWNLVLDIRKDICKYVLCLKFFIMYNNMVQVCHCVYIRTARKVIIIWTPINHTRLSATRYILICVHVYNKCVCPLKEFQIIFQKDFENYFFIHIFLALHYSSTQKICTYVLYVKSMRISYVRTLVRLYLSIYTQQFVWNYP